MEHFDRLETGSWAYLCRCHEGGQYWRIDEWEKYQIQFAIKIADIAQGREFDSTPLEKQHRIEMRGGLTEEICNWMSCNKRRIKGVAYCVDHLYATGTRE